MLSFIELVLESCRSCSSRCRLAVAAYHTHLLNMRSERCHAIVEAYCVNRLNPTLIQLIFVSKHITNLQRGLNIEHRSHH